MMLRKRVLAACLQNAFEDKALLVRTVVCYHDDLIDLLGRTRYRRVADGCMEQCCRYPFSSPALLFRYITNQGCGMIPPAKEDEILAWDRPIDQYRTSVCCAHMLTTDVCAYRHLQIGIGKA